MKNKQWFIIITILAIYLLYRASKQDCLSCQQEVMRVVRSCPPVRGSYTTIYRKINCFCDTHDDWQKLSQVIKHLDYYRDRENKKYPENIIGTKTISCFDDALSIDVFDDENVYLLLEQDLSKEIYDGALKRFSTENFFHKSAPTFKEFNIGADNRKIIYNTIGVIVDYKLSYESLNRQVLNTFQQVIKHDSAYQKQFRKVEYRLFRKENNKHEVSMRYEDSGRRFYFDVF
ncbi:hypothetical protein M0L20_22190 [Spirosoma sp. RP8]|uniref:Uncharacterized protein n=1 Tax=Spirosoma liriopis TaxID=2937440 RepID=A0ABT0HQZ0_9BACT|nr:hypothetical protein [Spirosoma liriopis]MCK8494595.1 hypothetical protein [Spirosoma liriopis]